MLGGWGQKGWSGAGRKERREDRRKEGAGKGIFWGSERKRREPREGWVGKRGEGREEGGRGRDREVTGFTSERAGRVTRVSVSPAAQLITTFSPRWQGAREQRLEGRNVNRAEKLREDGARKEKAEVRNRETKRKEEERRGSSSTFKEFGAGN